MVDLPSGTVTLLFTDIEGSTQLLRRLGGAYADVLAEHQRLLRQAFQAVAGREVDTQGDAFFVSFSRALDAVQAAVVAQRALAAHPWPEGAAVRVRMGLHTGEPTSTAERYVGLAVHRAARVGAVAHGGQILVSAATAAVLRDQLPPGIELKDLGAHRLKDFDRPEHLYQVVAGDLPAEFPPLKVADPAPLPPLPVPLVVEGAPLVGRERELSLLQERLAAALAGRGALALVGGEAGIGKTSLAEALCREALEQGARASVGRCYDLSETPPYGPWREALAALPQTPGLPPLPAALAATGQGEAASQEALFAQAHAFLAASAAQRPLVLLLDDLHWADRASLDLLRFMARQLAGLPLLLLATYRADELTRRHPLYQLLPLLVREARAAQLDLRALPDDAVRQLVRARYALPGREEATLVGYLQERAGGHPFFMGELLRTLEEERALRPLDGGWALGDLARGRVPRLLRQVIEGRLARLDDEDRRLLGLAAVIGQEAPLDLWRAVGGGDEGTLLDAIERAAEARILEETPGGAFRFTHALVREALYEGIVLPRRQLWHRRIAEALAAQPDPDPDAVAYHLRAAGDGRAAEWLVRAGERAQALHAPHSAIDRFSRALDLPGQLSTEQRLASYRARGQAYETVGDFAAAQADHEATLELARARGDRQAEWQALLDLGMLWASRDYARTESYYQRALDLARTADDPAMVARSLNRLGNWHLNMDRPIVAGGYHEEALATFRALEDRRGIAETLDFLGMTLAVAGDLRQSLSTYQQAVELFRALDDRQGLSSAVATMAERAATPMPGLLVPVGTLAESQRDAETALQIAREIGWRAGEVYATIQLGMMRCAHGDFGGALDAAQAAEDIATEIGHRLWLVGGHWLQALVYLEVRAIPLARVRTERYVVLAGETGSAYFQRGAATTLARVLIHEGEFTEAEGLLDTITGREFVPDSLVRLWAWQVRAELALARDDPRGALAILDQLVLAIPNAAPEHPPVWVALVRGEALAALGRVDAAEAGLRAAIRDATQHGYRPLLWRVHLALGRLYAGQGRRDAAAGELAAARAVVEQLAATIPDDALRAGFLRGVDALLTAVRLPTSQVDSGQAGGLTGRELEVLRLLAEGRSDREIAAALAITPRTAMTHVANILNKLGVGSRTAAASQAIRQGLI